MRERVSERGRRLYDRWASLPLAYSVVDRSSRPLRREGVDALELDRGDVALDVGCGPGASLEMLADAVGDEGRVLGVDYSEGMTTRARRRAVGSVLRGDARRLPLASGSVDGAFASLALSATPDVASAVAEVRRVLAPDGRFVVVDGRLPDGTVGRLLERAYARLVNWQGEDVLDVLRSTFPTVDVVATYDADLAFVAVARTE
jgi:demethylmenaquinone methyltransferase/2-methoxy-6-polyprenyl-1,4-benzoquinol methylase